MRKTARLQRKLQKTALRQRERELRALLNEWDPIGLVPDAPDDEYDCLIWPILRRLEDGVPAEALVAFLATQLEDHFGLQPDAANVAAFAERAKQWFDAAGEGTRA
jgi:hypothetical protein